MPLSFHPVLPELPPAADKIGLRLSAKACFNPTAAPECVFVLYTFFFEIFTQAGYVQNV